MVRRRRRVEPPVSSKSGHERWLVSYADFITLLFAFFVVMYSVSHVSEQKYRTLSNTLAEVFEGKVPVDASVRDQSDRYPLEDRGQTSGLSPNLNLVATEVLADQMEQSLLHLVEASRVTVTGTEEWVQIDVDAELLFDSGSAAPSAQARAIFTDIAELLAPFDNAIEVSGHTDNVPIHTERFASNWDLASARAASIVRLLADRGVAPAQMAAVGYGEYRPVASNATAEGRAKNRRVVLMVAKAPVQRAVLDAEELPGIAAETPAKEEGATTIPAAIAAPASAADAPETQSLQPVRLQSGGLLFSSDPEMPRNGE